MAVRPWGLDINASKQPRAVSHDPAELLSLLTGVADLAAVAMHKFRLKPDGRMSLPYATPTLMDVYGLQPEELVQDFSPAWSLIHSDDREPFRTALEKSASAMEPFCFEWRIQHPIKGEIWIECRSTPEHESDGSIVWYGYYHDITERKCAEADRLGHLRFFESMDRVNRAIQEASDIEQMMSNVLDVLLSIFGCERAWLVYPCDPGSASWCVPMERTTPEYPGGMSQGSEFDMNADIALVSRILLDAQGPVQFGPGSKHPVSSDLSQDFSVQSFIATALYPKTGKPWMFGLHQCSCPRTWDLKEEKLFQEIGRRLSDALTSLLTYRDLQEGEERFRLAFEFAGIGMALLSMDGRWLRVNRSICDMLGYTESELWQSSYQELTYPDDLQRGQKQLEKLLAGEIPYMKLEKRYRHHNGHYIWAVLTTTIVRSPQGQPLYFVSQIENIDEYRKTGERLAILSFALSHVQEAAYLIDEESRFLYVNDQACQALGYSRDELLHMGVVDIDPDFPMEHWLEHWNEIREKGSLTLETSHRRKDGKIFPVEVSANHFIYDNCGYNLALVRDITVRKEQESRIQYLAYHDALTDLPNRSLVMDRLDRALAQAQRHDYTLAILFIDLDRFKTINDTLGHPAGDTLLQQVGPRLSSVLRQQDTIGRMGGDEFLILLPELTSAEDVAHVGEKVLTSLSIPFQVAGQELRVTTSIGISLYPRDAADAATLVKYADTALYLAKEQGRNTFRFFSPELNARIQQRLHVESELRCAIERNELLLHYQPQMDLATGRITGVEALLRWQHPATMLIPPTDFIPIAEDIGLIIPIGEWVLRTASTQARRWQAAGIPNVRVCVNVSQRQLDQGDFAIRVQQILEETGCDPQLLEFEITESSVMNQPEQTVAKLQDLHEMGIQLALDDFGTGYSSLAYLKRFPLDRIKIDASFVEGVPDDIDDVVIVQTIIVLARQLRLTVVAEGVETEAQRIFLKENGCEEIQGYLLSRPLPANDLGKLFLSPDHALL